MRIDRFDHEQLPQRIVFGWGRVVEVADELGRLGAKRVLLISERSTASIADEIGQWLGPRAAATMPEVRPHSLREDVETARRYATEADIDAVLTVGGGSATGIGKTTVLEHQVPLVAVPTTYAGSEVTPIYGITENGQKKTGRDDRVLPRTVVYDPQLTTSLPSNVTAGSGLNALAHCIEALYAETVSPVASVLSEAAIRMLGEALPRCVADPNDRTARTEAFYGAYLAGTVLATTGMAIHHRICHVLGGTLGLAHGDANAVILPHAVAFNETAARPALERAARALDAQAAAPALFELARALGAPTSLKELGVERSDLERVTTLVVEGNFYNPRAARFEDVLGILQAAYEGDAPGTTDETQGDA